MKLWTIPTFGIENLQQKEAPIPTPGPGEVLVEVHACSLNYRDLRTVLGTYDPNLAPGRVPLSDGAGLVHAVGEGVSRFKTGDRVAAIFMQRWIDGPPTAATSQHALGGDLDGMAAQYVVLPEAGVVPVPAHLSFAQAATLPCAAVTAWSALQKSGISIAGSTVLIQGTGGVSIAALQLAKALGARVLGTSSSDEKLERARALGMDAGTNYRTQPEWARWAREQTAGEGVDLLIEVGGQGTLARSLHAVRVGGSIAQIGVLSQSTEPLPIGPILHRQLRIQGIYVGSRSDFEAMNAAIAEHKLQPVVDQEFDFGGLPDALRAMQANSFFGKLVVNMRT